MTKANAKNPTQFIFRITPFTPPSIRPGSQPFDFAPLGKARDLRPFDEVYTERSERAQGWILIGADFP
jgi:hypothetical protein